MIRLYLLTSTIRTVAAIELATMVGVRSGARCGARFGGVVDAGGRAP